MLTLTEVRRACFPALVNFLPDTCDFFLPDTCNYFSKSQLFDKNFYQSESQASLDLADFYENPIKIFTSPGVDSENILSVCLP